MKSMTGYGRGEKDNGRIKIVVEAKGVNNRYSEILIKQPRQYLALEERIKKRVSTHIERGRLEIFVRLQKMSGVGQSVKLDRDKAIAYHQGLQEIAGAVNEPYQLDIYRLAELPDVIVADEDEDDLQEAWSVLAMALDEAMRHHVAMRVAEGATIGADLAQKMTGIKALTAQIAQRSPVVLSQYRDKLQVRIAELLDGATVDEERLAQEVAYFAEKSCIDEELVRLSSHFQQFEQIVADSGSIGRKLDFLIQEMNRETNTIGSKANDSVIGQLVVEMKSELEKVREQVQNIE